MSLAVAHNAQRRSTRPAIHSLEARRHASTSTSTWSGSSPSDLSGLPFYGEALFGDNGDPYGTATGSTGTYGDEQAWSYSGWDSDLSDGVDSGWRSLTLDVNGQTSGYASFVGGGSGASFSSGTSLSFHQAIITADVFGSGYEVDVRNITVSFYHDQTLVEQVSPADLQSSTMTSTSGDPHESGVVVTTTANNINGIYVSGQVRLKAATGSYPGLTDLTATVAVG